MLSTSQTDFPSANLGRNSKGFTGGQVSDGQAYASDCLVRGGNSLYVIGALPHHAPLI
jgi:hypothetical protein